MRVAVLMSTYNGEKYVEKQIESIINQSGEFELELWVRDDGSRDQTIEILKHYEVQNKLRWYTGKNLGPAKSFIELIKRCENYDYYAFADQDDWWYPQKIEKAIEVLSNKSGMQLYVGNAEVVDSELNSMGRNVYKNNAVVGFKALSCAGGALGCTMVFNKELAKQIQNKKIPEQIIMHDFYLAELCLALGGEVTADKIPYMKYRQHQANVVGVAVGVMDKIKNRIKIIVTRNTIGIAEQAKTLIDLYGQEMMRDKYEWLSKIANYRGSLCNRFKLALSTEIKFQRLNSSITNRMSILFGSM